MDNLQLILYPVMNFSSHFSTRNEPLLNVFFCSGVLSETLTLDLVNMNNIATEAQKFNLVQIFYNHSTPQNLNISICFHLCVCVCECVSAPWLFNGPPFTYPFVPVYSVFLNKNAEILINTDFFTQFLKIHVFLLNYVFDSTATSFSSVVLPFKPWGVVLFYIDESRVQPIESYNQRMFWIRRDL